VVVVAQRIRVQTAYSPVFEDQLFHVLLPFAAYATIGIPRSRQSSQFVVRGRSSGTRTPLRWDPQCVGRRHLPRRCG
jgi:hypothetical protein